LSRNEQLDALLLAVPGQQHAGFTVITLGNGVEDPRANR
jgi:hypothetical protein